MSHNPATACDTSVATPRARDGKRYLPAVETSPPSDTDAGSYFIRLGDNRYRATRHTAGAWSEAEQHFSPLAGLLTHAIARFTAGIGDDLVTARISFDILGTVAIEDFDVGVDVVRPGRTIELLESRAVARGRMVARARAWRLAQVDTSDVAGGEPEPLPPPDQVASWPLSTIWPGGYIASLDFRPVRGPAAGHTVAWIRTPLALVAGEDAGSLARFVALVDTANGIATRVPPTALFYPNVDLTIHLYRQPTGAWVGLDTAVVFGARGQGLTSTTLHDERGPVGRAEQMLTIRRSR